MSDQQNHSFQGAPNFVQLAGNSSNEGSAQLQQLHQEQYPGLFSQGPLFADDEIWNQTPSPAVARG